MKPDKTIELPPKYYLDNFKLLLDFVEKMYGNILEGSENQFIIKFRQLSEDGQCLYLRMMNRRKQFFRINKFSYPEIEITPQLWQELFLLGFAQPVNEANAQEFSELFSEVADLFTKPELVKFAKTLIEIPKGFSQQKKPDILFCLTDQAEFILFMHAVAQSEEKEEIVAQGFGQESEFLLFLYFGNLYQNMTEFVIKDLGNSRYEDFEDSDFTPYFQNRKDVDDKFRMAKIYYQFRILREVTEPQVVFDTFINWLPERETLSHLAFSQYDKLVLRLGAWLEKQKHGQEALQIYEFTEKPPSRERQVRLWYKLGETDKALEVSDLIERSPQNADEKYFVIDFRNKLEKKRIKSTTAYLKEAPEIEISIDHQYQVEEGVLQHYQAQGYQGFHSENAIWRGFFGIFFWDIIFQAEAESVHNPFQRVPSDIYLPDFYLKRETHFLERVGMLDYPLEARALIEKNFEKKYGIFNPLTDWYVGLQERVLSFLEKLSPEQNKQVLLKIAKNMREHTRGLPDLFIYDDESYQFIEVKSPTDSLSAQQLDWLEFFKEIGVNATALKVVWKR